MRTKIGDRSGIVQLNRSIFNEFKDEAANFHPELKKKRKSKKPKSTLPTNRRDRRKLAKKLKKARRVAYATNTPLTELYSEILHKKKRTTAIKTQDDSDDVTEKESVVEKKEKKLDRNARKLQDLTLRIKEDEIEIKRFAKKLKLNKRKSKSLPKSFVDDGLSYVLELCDPEKRSHPAALESPNEETSFNSDDEDEIMSDNVESENDDDTLAAKSTSLSKKRVRFAEDVKEFKKTTEPSFNEDGDGLDDDDNIFDVEEDEDVLREDIYGRLRDKQGNIFRQETEKKLVEDVSLSAKRESLKKLFRSCINRLGEATVQNAVSQVQEAYNSYSRNASYFVEQLALEFKRLREVNSGISSENKTLDNVVLLFSHLFTLKVVNQKLVFDIIHNCTTYFEEVDIEMILLILQSVGFALRKENPAELKSTIDKINAKASKVDIASFSNQSRVKFMLDTLQSIKNNNALKVGNYDPETAEHFFKILRGLQSGKSFESPLPMSLDDLWSASVRGRWWVVGSAVIVPDVKQPDLDQEDKGLDALQFSDELLALAKKNRMNTELRRNIFCLLMSSEDYLDAFEKLTKLALKNQQEREIIHIALTCCLKEKSFNPFYVYLVQRFCTSQPRFTLTTQFAVWDKLKMLDTFDSSSLKNLASFLSHLLCNEVFPLTILKVVDFAQTSENCLTFLTALFLDFFKTVSSDKLKPIFMDCLKQKKFRSFFDGLKLFLQHIFPNRLSEKVRNSCSKKLSVVERLLYYSTDSFL